MHFLFGCVLKFVQTSISPGPYSFNIDHGLVNVSFDEGPTEKTLVVAEHAHRFKVPLTFHFVVDKIKDDIVEKVINLGHTVGLCFEELPENEDDKKRFILNSTLEFIEKTKYIPRLVRRPRSGFKLEDEVYCKSIGLIVTAPNLDSEDIEKTTYFMEFLIPTILREDPAVSSLSICLRDKFNISIESLEDIATAISSRGFEIVNMSRYLNMKAEESDLKNTKTFYEEELLKVEATNHLINEESKNKNENNESVSDISVEEEKSYGNPELDEEKYRLSLLIEALDKLDVVNEIETGASKKNGIEEVLMEPLYLLIRIFGLLL